MRRHIFGVAAATVAAPYLVVFTIYPLGIMLANAADSLTLFELLKYGTLALSGAALPVLVLSGICAAILNRLGVRSKWWMMASGAGLGLASFALVLSQPTLSSSDHRPAALSLSLSGALCGWIYWRIAIGRTGHSVSHISSP